jgi:Ala-tRNA(Pro) deacylase
MPMLRKLRAFLDDAGVQYEVLRHPLAYTSEAVAAAQHVPGRELAKVVVVKTTDGFVMAVLPATLRLDLHKLGDLTGDAHATLATEAEFADLFPGCEVGAMPPFGNLFDLPVYADRRLADDERIVFEAGTHTDTVRLAWRDYERLVRPTMGDLALMHEDV